MRCHLSRLLLLAALTMSPYASYAEGGPDAWSLFRARLDQVQASLPPAEAEALRAADQGGALAEIVAAWELAKVQVEHQASFELDAKPRTLPRGGHEFVRSRRAVEEALRREDPTPGRGYRLLDYGPVVQYQGNTDFPSLRTHTVKVDTEDGAVVRHFVCDLETGAVRD